MKILILLGCGASFVFAQDTPSVVQQAGDCSVNIKGNGSASLVCNSVDPKLAELVKSILNGTRRNEKAIEGISKQLLAIQADLDRPTLQIHQHSEGTNSPNTININQKLPARRIPPERRSEIVAMLARTPAKVSVSALANNAEAFQFAQDWYDAFKDAGWTMSDKIVISFLVVGQPDRGIMVNYHGETIPPGGQSKVQKDTPVGAILQCLIALKVFDTVHGQGFLTMAENELSFQVFEQPEN